MNAIHSFQKRVLAWLSACFGTSDPIDPAERNQRFLEKSLALARALGYTASEAHQRVACVFSRPVGEPKQEAGGVMLTLAGLCEVHDIDMLDAGETELKRVWQNIDQIRAKQPAKPKHSPLPVAQEPQPAADIFTAEQNFEAALDALIDKSPTRALSSLTGNFVGLTLGLLQHQGHEPTGDIKIDGGPNRDITIHAAKDAQQSEGSATC